MKLCDSMSPHSSVKVLACFANDTLPLQIGNWQEKFYSDS